MRYLVELTCVVDLPAGQNIYHLAESPLAEALCYGLRAQGVLAGPSPDHHGVRTISCVDGAAPDIERKAKRLRKKVARKAVST